MSRAVGAFASTGRTLALVGLLAAGFHTRQYYCKTSWKATDPQELSSPVLQVHEADLAGVGRVNDLVWESAQLAWTVFRRD